MNLRAVRSTYRVPGQLRLHRETWSQTKQSQNKTTKTKSTSDKGQGIARKGKQKVTGGSRGRWEDPRVAPVPKVYHKIQGTQERQGNQNLGFLPPCGFLHQMATQPFPQEGTQGGNTQKPSSR